MPFPFDRVDPNVCLKIAAEAERATGSYGKVTAIIIKWTERMGVGERQVWRYLEIGRVLLKLR